MDNFCVFNWFISNFVVLLVFFMDCLVDESVLFRVCFKFCRVLLNKSFIYIFCKVEGLFFVVISVIFVRFFLVGGSLVGVRSCEYFLDKGFFFFVGVWVIVFFLDKIDWFLELWGENIFLFSFVIWVRLLVFDLLVFIGLVEDRFFLKI